MANQQTPERVTSEPVPVPPPGDEADRENERLDREDFDRDPTDRTDLDRDPTDRDETDRDRTDRDEFDRDEYDQDGNRRDAAEDVTDRVPEDALEDRGSFEDPAVAGERRDDPDDLTAVSPDYHEPAPQQTAFGAATVGGAAAAAAQAGPYTDVRDRTDAADDDMLDPNRTAEDGAYVNASDPTVAVAEPVEPLDTVAPAAAVDDAPAVEEPVTGHWGEETVQGYRDRWRDVQLRFIDDPAGAAREANLLVEEAVGAFTADLSRQKESLSGWSDEDTEELRGVVRRHRDFLDRLLGL